MYDFFTSIFPFQLFVIPPLVAVIAFALLYPLLKKKRDIFMDDLLIAPGIGSSTWVTTAGKESHVYYDIDIACSSLENQDGINKWYIDNVREIADKADIDFLAFIERENGPVGAITKKDKISSELRIPSFIIRPRRKIKASILKGVTADVIYGKRAVIITDVTTTGHSVERVIDILFDYRVTVVGVVAVVNRGREDTEKVLKRRGVKVFRYKTGDLNHHESRHRRELTASV